MLTWRAQKRAGELFKLFKLIKIFKTLIWAIESSFWCMKTCRGALESQRSVLSIFEYHKYLHTSGTHVVHRRHMQKMKIFKMSGFHLHFLHVPSACEGCACCVHIVMMSKTRKFGLWRFQRTPARLYTTKTRFCSSNWVLVPIGWFSEFRADFDSFFPTWLASPRRNQRKKHWSA